MTQSHNVLRGESETLPFAHEANNARRNAWLEQFSHSSFPSHKKNIHNKYSLFTKLDYYTWHLKI